MKRGLPIALAVVAAVAVAVLVLVPRGGSDVPAAPSVSPAPSSSSPAPAPATVGAMPKSEPVALDIPKIGAHSTLVPLGLNADDTIEVPPVTTPLQAGWYTYAPTPGETGPAIVLGHVDGNHQRGIFFRLKELAAGDRVAITRKDGSTALFGVTDVRQVPKKDFENAGVYDDTSGPELRLITCGGVFDRGAHNYVNNIVVYARLIRA